MWEPWTVSSAPDFSLTHPWWLWICGKWLSRRKLSWTLADILKLNLCYWYFLKNIKRPNKEKGSKKKMAEMWVGYVFDMVIKMPFGMPSYCLGMPGFKCWFAVCFTFLLLYSLGRQQVMLPAIGTANYMGDLDCVQTPDFSLTQRHLLWALGKDFFLFLPFK